MQQTFAPAALRPRTRTSRWPAVVDARAGRIVAAGVMDGGRCFEIAHGEMRCQ